MTLALRNFSFVENIPSLPNCKYHCFYRSKFTEPFYFFTLMLKI